MCTEHGATEVYDTDDRGRGRGVHAGPPRGTDGAGAAGVDAARRPRRARSGAACDARRDRGGRGAEGVVIGTFGHAADGNLHPTVVFDAADPEQTAAARRAFDAMVAACLRLGGTISGEHGIGVLKQPFLEEMVGSTERELMAKVKAAFDPAGILNPGRGI